MNRSKPEELLREQTQLLQHWQRLFGSGRGKLNLSRMPIARLLSAQRGSRDDLRKFHDVFGWCAKTPARCAGAIYRTRAFMEIDPAIRDASKPRHLCKADAPRNMHIEHTVLVSQLHDMWLARPADAPKSPVFFLSHGIATAMHVTEECALRGDYKAHNPCYVDGKGLPFLRYAGLLPSSSSIWNVFTGEEIDIHAFTLADHRRTVRQLLEAVSAPSDWVEEIQVAAD